MSIGALNILDAEAAYSGADIEKALTIAERAAEIIERIIGELRRVHTCRPRTPPVILQGTNQ